MEASMVVFWLQLIVVLACVVIGARTSGVGIGLAGGFGLTILTFVFHLKPSSPPVSVLLIIVAVVTVVATLQAAGGLDYLVSIAEKILRKDPNRITIVGPIVAYVFTLLAGTAYVSLSVFPVIAEVAFEAKVRPERPVSISLVASKLAITGSPMSAATVALLALLSPAGITLGQIILVTMPAGFCATLVGALFVYKRGLELEDDPEYQRRLAAGEIKPPKGLVEREHTTAAKLSVWLFMVVIAIVVAMGTFKSLVPQWEVNGKMVPLSSPHTIEMLMLAASLLIVLICKVKPAAIVSSSTFRAGMTGVIAIFGVAWMTDTFFMQHKMLFIKVCADLVQAYPWAFSIALFGMSAILFSQGATVAALMPLGVSLGIPAAYLVAMFPAVNGTFFFPATGTLVGCMAFDQAGTTKIGKFVLNHSFMMPGLVATISAVFFGFVFMWVVI